MLIHCVTTMATVYQNGSLVGKPSFLSAEAYGVALLMLSAFLYSAMGLFIKLAASAGVPSIELVLFRGVFQGTVVISTMFCFLEEGTPAKLIQNPFGAARVRSVVIARGMVGGLGFVLHYYTITVLPLGDATALLSLSPIITVVASAIFLDEPFYAAVMGAAISSVVGSILIAQPSFLFGGQTVTSPGYIAGPLGSCCAAAVVMLVRKAGRTGVHTLQLLFSWCFFGVLYSGIANVALSSFVWPSSALAWQYIGCMTILGIGGHFLMNYAGRFAPASLTAIIRSSSILWAYGLEMLVFDQIPKWYSFVGASLILVSVVVVTSKQKQTQQSQTIVAEEAALLDQESGTKNDEYGGVDGRRL